MHGGNNSLAVAVTNAGPSPAGFAGKVQVTYERGRPLTCMVDTAWKSAIKAEPNWNAAKFDDSGWPAAVQIAKIGDSPWNSLKAPEAKHSDGCPLFRKEFAVHGEVRRATIYGSALGVYRLYLNGKPVGDDYFTPDWTDYKKRVYYDTYDVTSLVRSNGPNAIGGILGAGWYAGGVGWQQMRNHYGDKPRLFAQLEIEMADGTTQTIGTDGSWKTAFGPYLEGEFLAGETYDARQEIPGWAAPGLTDAAWQPVVAGHFSVLRAGNRTWRRSPALRCSRPASCTR